MTLAEKISGVDYLSYDFPTRELRRGGKWLDNTTCTANLLTVKKVLDSLNVPFWLMYGTLLGAYRDNKFIEYDSDTDLGLYYDSKEGFDVVICELMNEGFTLIRTAREDEIVSVMRDDEYIDFDFFHRENLPFNGLVPYTFIGHEFMIPENTEGFLDILYEGWRERIKGIHSVNYFGMHE